MRPSGVPHRSDADEIARSAEKARNLVNPQLAKRAIGSTGTECLGLAGRAIVDLLRDERRLSSEAFEAAES